MSSCRRRLIFMLNSMNASCHGGGVSYCHPENCSFAFHCTNYHCYCMSLGGMVLNPSYFGTLGHQNTMIHEMGHILGLYHVFKGVSERDSCDDPCQVRLSSYASLQYYRPTCRYVYLKRAFLWFVTTL